MSRQHRGEQSRDSVEELPVDHPRRITDVARQRRDALMALTQTHEDDLSNPELLAVSDESDMQGLADTVKREERAFIDADGEYRQSLRALDKRTGRVKPGAEHYVRPDFRKMSNREISHFLKSLPGYDKAKEQYRAEGVRIEDYVTYVMPAVRSGLVRVGSDFWTGEITSAEPTPTPTPASAPVASSPRDISYERRVERRLERQQDRRDAEPNDEDYQRLNVQGGLTARGADVYDGTKALEETKIMPDSEVNRGSEDEQAQGQSQGETLSSELEEIRNNADAARSYGERATAFAQQMHGGTAEAPADTAQAEATTPSRSEAQSGYQPNEVVSYTTADGETKQYSVVGPSQGERDGLILRELNSTRQFALDTEEAMSRVRHNEAYYTAQQAQDVYKSPAFEQTQEKWQQATESDADMQENFWQSKPAVPTETPTTPEDSDEVTPFIDYSKPPFGPGEPTPPEPPKPPEDPGPEGPTPPEDPEKPEDDSDKEPGTFVRPTVDGIFALHSEKVNDAIRKLAEAKDAREALVLGGRRVEAFEAAKSDVEDVYAQFLTDAGETSGKALKDAEYAKGVAEATKATFTRELERARTAGDTDREAELMAQITDIDTEIARLEKFPVELQTALALELSQLRTRVEEAQTEVKSEKFAGKLRNWWKAHPKTRLAIGVGLAAGGLALGGVPGIIMAGGAAAMRGVGAFMGVEGAWNIGHGWREKFRNRGEMKQANAEMGDSYKGDIEYTANQAQEQGLDVRDPKAFQEFMTKNNQALFGPESLNKILAGDTEKAAEITSALLKDQMERMSRDAKSARTAKIAGVVAGVASVVGGYFLRNGGGGRPKPPTGDPQPPTGDPGPPSGPRIPSPDEARFQGARASGPNEFGISQAQADERTMNLFKWIDKVQAGEASPPTGFNPELLKDIDKIRPKLGFTDAEQFRVFDQLTGDLSNEHAIPLGGRIVEGQEAVLNNASRIAELIKQGQSVDSLKAMLRAGTLR